MSPTLPLQPNLEHLKKQAKDLQKTHKRGDSTACSTLRHLRHFVHASDAEIIASPISLRQAQHALAKSYGFANWAALKSAVDLIGETTSFVAPRTAVTELPASVQVQRQGARTWLTPIPRYPWEVEYLDEQGQTVRVEQERTGRLLGNLYAAMRMQDRAVTWEQVAAASGECFRFTFEGNWAQDAEYVTPIDAFANACELLGFSYTAAVNSDLKTATCAIDEALRAGQPAVAGMVSRFWRVIVGVDRDTEVYYTVGGVRFEGWERVRVAEGTAVSPQLELEECLPVPVPQEDWHNAIMAPEQAARNPVCFVGNRRPIPSRESIVRTLQLALEMQQPRVISRANLNYRKCAVEMGPAGHDGWKFYYSPWPGEFTIGTEGYRAWDSMIAGMAKPSDNFEMIHGNTVTFAMQVRKMHDAAAYLG